MTIMLANNVFGKIAGIIFYVCIGLSVCLLAYGGIRRLIQIFKTRKKLKEDKDRLLKKNDDKKTKAFVDENKK